ncbi:apoptosis-inducing factor, mitochondrion-associated, C-term-domain-containing protein [Cunninghamella echinulata]|nr:apoptosis-inducing factor, mitochondrion-associated, C-term-domain-containing protein [Cunninghamella echinulata]
MISAALRVSARRSALRTLPKRGLTGYRAYSIPSSSQQHSTTTGSATPWAIGSLLVFGPILFKLTSPPPKPKKQQQHIEHESPIVNKDINNQSEQQDEKEQVTTAPVKKIQKPYVLIGAGTASFAAAQAIKELDSDANVIIIGDESYAPYMRPPLSKEIWFSEDPEVATNLRFKDWQGNERSIYYQDESLYEIINDASGSDLETDKIKLLLGKPVTKLNVEDHTVTLADGSVIYYNKVLLATGGAPKHLPKQPESSKITTFRTVEDLKQLDAIVKPGSHVAVIGGGFLGSELAVALANRASKQKDIKITQVFPEEGNMANVFPSYLTKWTTTRVQKLGVDVKSNSVIDNLEVLEDGNKVKLTLNAGNDVITADHVVVAIGIEPRVNLAREAGLEIDEQRSGVVVNAELEARKDVYAAGDMVSFHDIQLGRRRIEHHDHAVLSGRHAGQNMVGKKVKPYRHQSMFWSDLGPEVGYEAVGLIDSQLSTISVWAKSTEKDTPAVGAASESDSPRIAGQQQSNQDGGSKQAVKSNANPVQDEKFGKGLVFYVRDRKIVGLVLFNVFGKVQEARDIIDAGLTSDKVDNLLKKFNLYDEDDH